MGCEWSKTTGREKKREEEKGRKEEKGDKKERKEKRRNREQVQRHGRTDGRVREGRGGAVPEVLQAQEEVSEQRQREHEGHGQGCGGQVQNAGGGEGFMGGLLGRGGEERDEWGRRRDDAVGEKKKRDN